MMGLRQLVAKVAPTEATVLVTGENGTGKELVANELFRRSNRAQQPYIRVNCAAVSESLIESEFFGHEKGSFTGAVQRREGRFELANNGTILLDEVSEISLRVQAKLLRVLQEREFERVGGNKTIKVNVRVIATTNRDLTRAVERGEFRQDLYYRLNVFPIQVPPLRARMDDVVTLARFFMDRFARKHGVRIRGIADDAQAVMLSHSWPGNVRELQNTIERAVILTENGAPLRAAALGLMPTLALPSGFVLRAAPPVQATLTPAPAPASASMEGPVGAAPMPPASVAPPVPVGPVDGVASTPPMAPRPTARPLDQIEKEHILVVLEQEAGNRTKAATVLGISIRTLRNKLAQYREQGTPIIGDD
jgi:DNA-binding NtrC family response regulator